MLLLAILVAVAAIVPAMAGANAGAALPEISAKDLPALVASSTQQIRMTDPQIAEELPRDELSRSEVLDLLAGVFSTPLEDAIGPFDELPVADVVSNHSVVLSEPTEGVAGEIGSAGQGYDEPVLMESTIPLLTEGPEGERSTLDLSLEPSANGFQSEAPLVDVSVPDELGDGIDLPDAGISLSVNGAPDGRAPSLLGSALAVYPNIAEDVDFAVSPTPTGFETFTTLRTPDAPTSQSFSLDIPDGASLRQDGAGGVVEAANGTALLKVHPPTAIDAAGASVPVTLTVKGDTLTVSASPGEGTAWPILVDPFYESYTWNTKVEGLTFMTPGSWKPVTNNALLTAPALANWGGSQLKYGMHVKAAAGSYAAGAGAAWWYKVPRLDEEQAQGKLPTSYIVSMTLSGLYYKTNAGPASPYAVSAIYDQTKGGWAGQPGHEAVWVYPGNGAAISGGTLTIVNGEPGKRDELAQEALGIDLASFESMSLSTGRDAYVEAATVELGDSLAPKVSNPSFLTTWVNGTASEALSITATDSGLGVKGVVFNLPGQSAAGLTNSCPGTAMNPCPSSWTPSLAPGQYDPGKMPQGINNVGAVATDLIGNSTPWSDAAIIQVKVDHTKPALALSGTATEQATLGTKLPSYTLKYDATDGDAIGAQASTPFGTPGTGEKGLESPQGIAVDPQGDIVVADSVNQRLLEFDRNGNFLRKIGSGVGSGNGQMNSPRGVAVNANGDIWVAESGNKRLQMFNASGQFVRTIKLDTQGKNYFTEPWGIAVGPNETLWVADPAAQKVFRFKEDGTYLGPVTGSSGLGLPVGVAVDSSGAAWVTDQGFDKVWKFDSAGKYVSSFGSEGTGNGQFKDPFGIAVANSGNVLVVDGVNNRVQEFKTDGSYLAQFGSAGTGNAQLSAPRGIAVGPGNTAVIADTANKRVSRWDHADLDRQSGVTSVKVKLDGTVVHEYAPGCATQSCPISKEWTLNADNYSVGSHNLEVIATDGVGLTTTKSIPVETHGDLAAPSIALSGTMTEQATLGKELPSYTIKVNATDPGSAEERQSGVASTTIKVDGKVVDSSSPGCPAGSCSMAREWTLKSDDYAASSHVATVTATDAIGKSTTKNLIFSILRDKNAPTLTANNSFYNAPEGWLEQKTYMVNATAADAGGYGITSIALKIDGQTVKSNAQTCSAGGCSLGFGGIPAVSMAAYVGGAHPAELIASDGAGNTAKKTWTINVDPKGGIPADEATETLEAMEATVPAEHEFQPVAATEEVLEEQVIEAGDNPHFVEEEGVIQSTGVTTDTEIDPETGEIEIEGTMGPIALEPEIPTSAPEISEQSAAVLPGSAVSADAVVRPEYNGAQMFTTIRDASAPLEYGWHIRLNTGQYLEQVDPQHIAVNFEDGERAWLISAEPAHDAVGTDVLTSLVVDGSDVVLTVKHREPGVVYPVVAGQSYETGYSTVLLVLPSPEPPSEEELGDGVEGLDDFDLGPPTAEELEDADAYLKKAKPQRDKNKPVHLKQARRLSRSVPFGQVPPPSYNRIGGPNGGNNEIEELEKLTIRSCSAFGLGVDGCGIWNVDFDDNGSNESTYNKHYKWNGHQWVDSYVSIHTPYYCSTHVAWWWSLNIELDLGECGHHLPYVATAGSGKRLTYFVKYDIGILWVPELPGEVAEKHLTLVNQVFPNGYQRAVTKTRYSNLPNPFGFP